MVEEHDERRREALANLFSAKWNIPQAVAALGREANGEEWVKMKEEFREYCRDNLPTYKG